MQTDIFDIYPPTDQDNPEQEVVSPVQEDNTLTLDDPAISAIEQERQTAIDNINANYEQLAQQLEQQPNPADAIFATIQRRKVVDPRVVNARRNLGSLYDAFQTLGTLAAMNGRTTLPTPPAPAIHPAAAEQNQLADRLAALQLDADNQYFSALRNAQAQKNQFERNRSNQLASLRRQQQREIDDANTFHTRRADAYRRQKEAEEHRWELHLSNWKHRKELQAGRNTGRGGGRGTSASANGYTVHYEGKNYVIRKQDEKQFQADAFSLMSSLNYSSYKSKKLKQELPNAEARARYILEEALNSSDYNVVQQALDILSRYTVLERERPYTVTPAVESPAAQPTSLTPPSQTTIPRDWDLN